MVIFCLTQPLARWYLVLLMKRKIQRLKTEKLSISLPIEMAQWLRSQADEDMSNVSETIRKYLISPMKSSRAAEGRPQYGDDKHQ